MKNWLSKYLHRFGCRHGFVVHGMDGMDEITNNPCETLVAEVTSEGVVLDRIKPEDLGIRRCTLR